ncbi:reverse transcriptase domain-containing protein, partial [Tanacetum coccineum]
EYGVSTSIRYGVSNSLSNTTYSFKLINTAYPLPLNTAYQSSGTEACMTRSSTNKLFTPYKEPAREFRSSRRHFKTLSPDELRSPDFNLLSDQEYSEEEEAEAMAETMEQYMIKTRTDYGSGVARPKIDNKDIFEQKGQFLKELRKNTFSGSDNEDTNEHIEKVLKIVDLFHVPNITEDQLILQVFPISLTRAEVILFYNGLDVPTRQILNSRGAVPTKIAKDAKKAIQEMVEYSQNGTMEHLKEENSTLLYKSRQTTVPFPIRLDNHYCEEEEGNYGPKFMEAYKVSHIRASVSVMPLLTYLNLGLGKLAHTRLTMELADRTVKYPKRIAENVLVGISKFTFPLDFIILDMPEDIKVPLILGRPFFLIKRVYMLCLREIMELDLEARLMGETLVLNRSLDPFLEDYIELKDLNEPFELRRTQGDDLMPTIEEGKVIEKFRTRNEDLDTGIDDYPSYCDDDKKIHIDCAHNLKFSCIIGFEFTHANFFPLLYNVMSKKFHNSIMKDKMVYKGDNVVGSLLDMPIFVGTFSVMTDFAVLEDMDAYSDEGIGDVIFGEIFLREVGIKTKRFEGIITLYKSDDEHQLNWLAEEKFLKIKQVVEEEQTQPEYLQELLQSLLTDLQILNEIQPLKQETLNQIQKDQEEKSTVELLAEERLQKDNQVLNESQSSKKMRIQIWRSLKATVLEEMKEWMNDLGIREYRKEEIHIDYRRKCEDKIYELKDRFNGLSIEIGKITQEAKSFRGNLN